MSNQTSDPESLIPLIKDRKGDELQQRLRALSFHTAKAKDGTSIIQLSAYYNLGEIARKIASKTEIIDILEAATVGNLRRLKALVNKDPSSIHAWSNDGFTPVQLACAFGSAPTVDYLLRNGAKLDEQSRNKNISVYPIHAALFGGNIATVRVLIKWGADVNVRQSLSGETPLHEAAFTGREDLVKLLLDAGADRSMKTNGKTPYDIAVERNAPGILDLLRLPEGTPASQRNTDGAQ
ncbi:MAG TPA: ankyrin repeat domain-containing protein [Candidatus Hodarchaeales archaeon]|nr:ankyrin repeat domain-containing protein [Candidatus Hodarchaeales archaeon]